MLKKIWATAKTFLGFFADRSEYGQSADRKVHKYDNHGVRNSRSERGFSNYEYLAVSVIEQIASDRSNIFEYGIRLPLCVIPMMSTHRKIGLIHSN